MPVHSSQLDLTQAGACERRGAVRYTVQLPVVVIAWNQQRYRFRALNISRGGLLLNGDLTMKNLLYRRKNRYTHRPVRVTLELQFPVSELYVRMEAISRYVQRRSEQDYLSGMRFLTSPPAPLLQFLEVLATRSEPR